MCHRCVGHIRYGDYCPGAGKGLLVVLAVKPGHAVCRSASKTRGLHVTHVHCLGTESCPACKEGSGGGWRCHGTFGKDWAITLRVTTTRVCTYRSKVACIPSHQAAFKSPFLLPATTLPLPCRFDKKKTYDRETQSSQRRTLYTLPAPPICLDCPALLATISIATPRAHSPANPKF